MRRQSQEKAVGGAVDVGGKEPWPAMGPGFVGVDPPLPPLLSLLFGPVPPLLFIGAVPPLLGPVPPNPGPVPPNPPLLLPPGPVPPLLMLLMLLMGLVPPFGETPPPAGICPFCPPSAWT